MSPVTSTAPSDVTVEEDLPVPMRDGTVLRADVYRPHDATDLPVLLLRIPYNKFVAQSYVYGHPTWYARHGYIVVVQDTRGRYNSEGEFWPLRGEATDGVDSIEWCAALPGSSGKVGTFGFSYSGINQLLTGSLRPRGLGAACPGFYPNSMYEGFGYVGGAFALSTMAQWLTILAGDRAVRLAMPEARSLIIEATAQVGHWSPSVTVHEVPLLAANPLTPFAAEMLEHPAYDEFWHESDLERMEAPTDLPCLHVSGWYDTFLRQTFDTYARLMAAGKAEQRLLVGPWVHMPWAQHVGGIDFGREAGGQIVDRYQLAFYDAHLKGDRRALDALPPVTVFLLGANRWASYDSWPPPGAMPDTFYLHSDGKANSLDGDGTLSREPPGREYPDIFIYDPQMPVQSVGGHSCCSAAVSPMGPYDQSMVETRNDVLCYTTSSFDKPIELLGPIELELYAATTAADTDFTAKLCHVRQDGEVINLCEGIVRARFATDRTREVLLPANQVHRFVIALGQTAVHLAAGERLRLEVSSSNYPTFDRNPNTGGPLGMEAPLEMVAARQTIHHDAARPSVLRLWTRQA
jgi:putative CocE/NonD family hydrolase